NINGSAYVGGAVGIGTTAPSEKLHVIGNILATGTITPGCSREFKMDIHRLPDDVAADVLRRLDPVEFRYRAGAGGEIHLGFIAEDVPDLIARAGRKGVDPMDIVAVLTKVVQQQQAEIRSLREEMKAMKSAGAERRVGH